MSRHRFEALFVRIVYMASFGVLMPFAIASVFNRHKGAAANFGRNKKEKREDSGEAKNDLAGDEVRTMREGSFIVGRPGRRHLRRMVRLY